MTPHQLFLFAESEILSMKFHFSTTSEYEEEAALLANRFECSRTVAGTHKLHSIKPISAESVEVKEFSASLKSRTEKVIEYSDKNKRISPSEIKGYITAKYDNHLWLGCVMQTFLDNNEMEINFLHPHGPARSFHYPHPTDMLVLSCDDVLTTGLQPKTITGRSYMLSSQEMMEADNHLLYK